jgi:hypothetical protein
MKIDIGKGLEVNSHGLNAVLSYYLPGRIGEKHIRPQSRQLVFELGTAYSITVRPTCLFRALYRGILNGVTL